MPGTYNSNSGYPEFEVNFHQECWLSLSVEAGSNWWGIRQIGGGCRANRKIPPSHQLIHFIARWWASQ